jgi:SAM-dependent methyltransferase
MFVVIYPAARVRQDLAYLRCFHRQRLRPGPRGTIREETLADRADFTQDYVTDIVACTTCGCVCRTPRPTTPTITQAYAQDQYGQERLAALFATQAPWYRTKAHWVRRWLPTGAGVRVVEVGSFVGGFLAAGQHHGWQMLGVDPGAEVNAFCHQKGLPVFAGTLEEVPLPQGSVDCVAIWNTFDQLPDPRPTLAAATRLLRPGGLLVLRVPHGECFRRAARWLRRTPAPWTGWLRAALAWNNLLAFPYLQGYAVPTLDRLLRPYGFTRLRARPDTLPPLADEQTKSWAVWEEGCLKRLWFWVARLQQLRPDSRLTLAPWIEVCYRHSPPTENEYAQDPRLAPNEQAPSRDGGRSTIETASSSRIPVAYNRE